MIKGIFFFFVLLLYSTKLYPINIYKSEFHYLKLYLKFGYKYNNELKKNRENIKSHLLNIDIKKDLKLYSQLGINLLFNTNIILDDNKRWHVFVNHLYLSIPKIFVKELLLNVGYISKKKENINYYFHTDLKNNVFGIEIAYNFEKKIYTGISIGRELKNINEKVGGLDLTYQITIKNIIDIMHIGILLNYSNHHMFKDTKEEEKIDSFWILPRITFSFKRYFVTLEHYYSIEKNRKKDIIAIIVTQMGKIFLYKSKRKEKNLRIYSQLSLSTSNIHYENIPIIYHKTSITYPMTNVLNVNLSFSVIRYIEEWSEKIINKTDSLLNWTLELNLEINIPSFV